MSSGLPCAFALRDEVLLDVGVDAELARAVLEHQRLVAGRLVAGRDHVRLRTGPPHAHHLVAREADAGRFLDCGRVHHAPAPQQHVVGPVLTDLQPLRLLLDARVSHRDRLELEAMLLGAGLERSDRLLAVRAVVIDEADLLALQLVETAPLLGDVLNGDVRRGPVAADRHEIPGEHRTVAAFRTAVAHGEQRDLVAGHLLGQRERDAGRKRREVRGARRALALHALVALDALVGGVAGLAFFRRKLDAVDAAVALVDHVPVVDHAVRERNAVRRVRSGAIHQGRHVLFALRHRRGGHRDGSDRGGKNQSSSKHCFLS